MNHFPEPSHWIRLRSKAILENHTEKPGWVIGTQFQFRVHSRTLSLKPSAPKTSIWSQHLVSAWLFFVHYLVKIRWYTKTKKSIEQNYEHTKIRLQRSFTTLKWKQKSFQTPPVFVQKNSHKNNDVKLWNGHLVGGRRFQCAEVQLFGASRLCRFFFETASRL